MTETAAETTVLFGKNASEGAAPVAVVAAGKAVALAAGKDSTLPILLNVQVTVTDGGVKFATTDRYRLHVATVEGDVSGPETTVLVNGKLLAKALTSVSKATWMLRLKVTSAGLTVDDGESSVFLAAQEGDFPKVDKLIPAEDAAGTDVALFSVDPTYFADACKACGMVAAGKGVPVLAGQVEANKPLLVRPKECATGVDFRALVMPVRIAS